MFCSLKAQQTEKLYLSGAGNDNTVNWDFFCTAGACLTPVNVFNHTSPGQEDLTSESQTWSNRTSGSWSRHENKPSPKFGVERLE